MSVTISFAAVSSRPKPIEPNPTDGFGSVDQRRGAQQQPLAGMGAQQPLELQPRQPVALAGKEILDPPQVPDPGKPQDHPRSARKDIRARQQGAGIKGRGHSYRVVASVPRLCKIGYITPAAPTGGPAPAAGTVKAVDDDQLTLGASLSLRHLPLAERMRPRTLDEVVGQPQLTAPDAPLRVALASGAPHSMVLWGPPGTGKTTIALCVAKEVDAEVEQLNAVTDGIKELRAVIARAEQRRGMGGRTLLFIDEIARWNKAQQDALLPYVENGTVVLVGSTTENPGFELNRALVSRLQVHVVLPLQDEDLTELARRALTDATRGVGIPVDDPRAPYELDRPRPSTSC